MKLRNKKTGEVVELIEIVRINDVSHEFYLRLSDNEGRAFKVGFNSLAELNTEWEDYEESKEYWYIDYDGGILCGEADNSSAEKMMISMGNHFKSLEEAEQAVEKLKAYKRLKDNGFRFEGMNNNKRKTGYFINFYLGKSFNSQDECEQAMKDLDLLFGGEE